MQQDNSFKTENKTEAFGTSVSTTADHDKRTEKILQLSDRVLEKISRALDEIDVYITKDKKRIKEVEYDDELKKPTKEIYTEKETIQSERSTIDTSSLKQLVSTLKDIRDIQTGIRSRDEDGGDEERGLIVISEILNTEENDENHMDTPEKTGDFSVSS